MADFFTDNFMREFERQSELLGRFNLGVFGKTGVGKSTLINAVFGEPVAKTGIGEPVTVDSQVYLDRRGTLGLIDTRGLEIGADNKEITKQLKKTVEALRKKPLHEQMHAAWYCVRGMDRRFEESEAEVIQTLVEMEVPVMVVMTQVPMREGQYHPDAIELARQIQEKHLPIVEGRVFMTFAMRDQFTGQPPYGLMELLQATFRVVPQAVRGALATAQQVDLRLKAREANTAVGTAVTAAAAAAASPIPFSDAAMLVPIQLAMLARIAQLYNVRVDRAAMMAIASTAIATTAGRATFTNLIKLIPGAGTVAGGAISAGVASTFTLAMGQAWIAVCQKASQGGLQTVEGLLDSSAVQNLFMKEFKARVPGVRRKD